jgi:hypothetical protein
MPSNVTVNIGADARQALGQIEVLKASIRDLGRETGTAARTAARTGDELAFAKAAQGAAQISELKGQVEGLQKSMAGVDGAAKLNRGGLLELQAAGVNSFQALASGMDVVRVAMMEGAQVIGALVQGGVVGFSSLLSPLGLIAAAATAAGAAVAYIGYQAYQTRLALGSMQAELLLTGRAGTTEIDAVGVSAQALAAKFDLSKRAAAELLAEVSKARTLNADQIRQVAELAAAEGRARRASGEDVKDVDIAKRMAAALGEGAAGAIKLANSYNIATTAAEQMLKSGNELGAFNKVLADLEAHIRSHGGAWAEAKAASDRYTDSINNMAAALGEAGGPALEAFRKGAGPEPPRPTERPSGGTGMPGGAGAESMRAWLLAHGYTPQAAAGIMGNADIESGFSTSARNPTGHFGLFQWDKTRQAPLGGSTDFNRQMELMDEELNKLDPSFKKATDSAGVLARRFEQVFERSGGQSMAGRVSAAERYAGGDRGGGAETQFAEKAQREREAREVEQQERLKAIANRNSLAKQAEAAQAHYDQVREIVRKENANISDEDLAADQRVQQALVELNQRKAALYDQDTSRAITGIKAREAATVDSLTKIKAQQEAVRTLEARGAPVTEIEGAKNELAAMRRQLYQQETELHLGRLRQQMAAETDPQRRVAISEQIVEVRRTGGAGVPGRSAEGVAPVGVDKSALQQAETELAGVQRQGRAEQLAIKEDEVSRARTLGQQELAQYTAQQELLVAQGKQSKDTAVSNEAAATDRMLAKQREAAQGLLELAVALGMSERQVAKYREALTLIDTDRATKAAQFQTKQAEAQKALTEKWVEPLKSALNSIGSSVEGAITGILTRKKTWAQAMQEVRDSMISSLVSAAGSMLSKLAAKSLGAVAGEGLGEFVGTQLLKNIGIGDVLGTGGQVANTAALTGNTAAVVANTAAVTAAAAASGASAAGSAASALPAAAVAVAALRFGGIVRAAGGMIVPSAAGGWALPGSFGSDRVLSALTPGEMVLPRQISGALQAAVAGGGIGGGTHQYSINVSAIDSRSGAQFLMGHADAIAAAMSSARRNFSSSGRALR